MSNIPKKAPATHLEMLLCTGLSKVAAESLLRKMSPEQTSSLAAAFNEPNEPPGFFMAVQSIRNEITRVEAEAMKATVADGTDEPGSTGHFQPVQTPGITGNQPAPAPVAPRPSNPPG